jgi:hypothetical protein
MNRQLSEDKFINKEGLQDHFAPQNQQQVAQGGDSYMYPYIQGIASGAPLLMSGFALNDQPSTRPELIGQPQPWFEPDLPLEYLGFFSDKYDHVDCHSSLGSVSPPSTDTSLYLKNNSVSPSISSIASSPSYTYSKSRKGIDGGKIKRSRMGCLTCRQRKKRCCEARPYCGECARLGLKCTWPERGSEHKNKPKRISVSDDMHYDPFYGSIKILRGIVHRRL